MDPEVRRRRTLDAIKRLLLRESLNQPLILIFEDLHWIDEGSRALLNLLADSIGTARVLMLVNYRPEFTHNWGNKTYYTQLRLDPLGAESGEEMLQALLDDEPRTGAAQARDHREDRRQSVLHGRDRAGAVRAGRPAAQRLDQARQISQHDSNPIDRAGGAGLAHRPAAAGAERPAADARGDRQGVSAQAGQRSIRTSPTTSCRELLAELQIAEFIYEQPAVSDVAYVFKHALSQQVAYGSTLLERRRVLHERIARVSSKRNFPRRWRLNRS